jgi:hypothetical protein
MNLLGHHPKKAFSHENGMTLNVKGILILFLLVNGNLWKNIIIRPQNEYG